MASLADVRLQPGVGTQYFLLVGGTAVVEDDVPDHHQELLAFSGKAPRERVLTGDVNQPFPHPNPELFLRGPELVFVRTNNSSCLLCFFHDYAFIRRDNRVPVTPS